MYLLLDSNVTAGYYLPRSLSSKRAQSRIQIIFDSVRSRQADHFFYIPNFCVAEVFSVFMKHAFGAWNRQVKKKGKTIDKRVYEHLVGQFQDDIHNGKFLYHYELSRYHILGIGLVAPIDHYFKVRKKKNGKPMGTFDHLIISMGVHLAHIHGVDNVKIITADHRLTDILEKCRNRIHPSTIKKLKLTIAEDVTGRPFSSQIFPQGINLASSSDSELRGIFGAWPLPLGRITNVYRWTK